MILRISKLTAATAVGLVLTALAGCSGAEPDSAPPPPPPASVSYDRAPVDLAGAAPAPMRYQDGLAGGPGSAPRGPIAVGMAPIPDPEDLPQGERHRIYGYKYDGGRRVAREDYRPARRSAPVYPARTAPAHSTAVRAPAAHVASAVRPAPVTSAPARPAVVAKAPVTAKPVLKSAPAVTPAVPVAPLDPKLAKLQTSLAPQVSSASTLTLGAPLSLRQEGPVVLTLPQNLFDLIRKEAAKLGLGRAARSSEVSATLSGQGYEITPSGPQTAKLKSGEAASFKWQVKPGAGELGPLRAQIDAALRGQRKPLTFSMAAVEKAVTVTIPEAAKRTFKLPKLNLGKLNLGGIKLPNYGQVDVPGLGKTSSQSLIGGGLVLLAILLLIAIARNAAEAKARAKRRRKFRTMADYGQMDPEPVVAAPVVTTAYHDRDGDGVPETKVETHEVAVHREPEKV